jgi:ABC-type bacteriocin/lantibiotic exporter with double-glycine peptidase domain
MNGWTNRATWLIELWFNPESVADVQSAKEHFETAVDKVPDFLKDFIDSDVNWEELEEQFKEDEEEDEEEDEPEEWIMKQQVHFDEMNSYDE